MPSGELIHRGNQLPEGYVLFVTLIIYSLSIVPTQGVGKRMGGGKGSIHHYVTPVRAGRVIVEVGGKCEFEEVHYFLENIANKLPLDAIPIDNTSLERFRARQGELEAQNVNPISFERVLKLRMGGSSKWASPYDELWHGKYV